MRRVTVRHQAPRPRMGGRQEAKLATHFFVGFSTPCARLHRPPHLSMLKASALGAPSAY